MAVIRRRTACGGARQHRSPARRALWRALIWSAGIALLAAPGAFAAQWSAPVRLSVPGESSWFPDVAADASGRVHVAWASGFRLGTKQDPGSDSAAYSTSADGERWTPPIDIMVAPRITGSIATRPALTTDAHGTLHLLFRAMTVLFYARVPLVDIGNEKAWSVPVKINRKQVPYYGRMVIDRGPHLHAVFTENVYDEKLTDCVKATCFHLYYTSSNDGGASWPLVIDVSRAPTGTAKPQLVLASDGSLHVVWESGLGGGLGYVSEPTAIMRAASFDGGATWTEPQVLAEPRENGHDVALVEGAPGELLAVWGIAAGDRFVFSRSTDSGRTWSEAQPIEGAWTSRGIFNSPTDYYALAADSAGHVHLVAAGRLDLAGDAIDLIHMSWDGAAWSAPDVITTLKGDVPDAPRLAMGLGNQLHAVWFVRDRAAIWNSYEGDYSVWYAHGVADAPAVAAAPWPAPVIPVLAHQKGARLYAPPLGTGFLREAHRGPRFSGIPMPSEWVVLLISLVAGAAFAVLLDPPRWMRPRRREDTRPET